MAPIPEAWIGDYAAALAHVRGTHRGVPLTMLGQTLAVAVAVHAAGEHPTAHPEWPSWGSYI